jgi:hypothetical protein
MGRHLLAVGILASLGALGCARSGGGDCDSVSLVQGDAALASHTSTCDSACGNGQNPPSGGPHCGSTLSCRVFTEPQKRCQWLHNLEHGHVVLLYNCPDGCPDIVQTLTRVQGQVAPGGNGVRRALVSPDPDLPSKVAAVVWGWAAVLDTADEDAIACLMDKQQVTVAPEPDIPCAP